MRDYDRLLMGGIWAQVDLRHQYDEEQKGKRSPFWIDSIKLLTAVQSGGGGRPNLVALGG
jgi:predicted ATP-dependent Lon-type protease